VGHGDSVLRRFRQNLTPGDDGIAADGGELTVGEDVRAANDDELTVGEDVRAAGDDELTGGEDLRAADDDDLTLRELVDGNREDIGVRREVGSDCSRLRLMWRRPIGVRREVILVRGDPVGVTPEVVRVISDVIHTVDIVGVMAVIDERDGDAAEVKLCDFALTI
jgi:hypothetical protein